jgi:hypothetical protein
MSERKVTLVLTDLDDDDHDDYAEMANAVWMLLQVSRHEGRVEIDGKTDAALVNSCWDDSAAERQWH